MKSLLACSLVLFLVACTTQQQSDGLDIGYLIVKKFIVEKECPDGNRCE